MLTNKKLTNINSIFILVQYRTKIVSIGTIAGPQEQLLDGFNRTRMLLVDTDGIHTQVSFGIFYSMGIPT